jgi:hypothetical protein
MAECDFTLNRDCTKCGINKPLTEFHRAARGLHGRQAFCKECASEMARIRYEEKSAVINAKTLAKYHQRQEPIRLEKAQQKALSQACATKLCAKCRQIKDKSLFGRARERPDGLKPYCKVCSNNASGESRRRNLESSRKSVRDYYQKNKAKRNAAGKIWREKNKERMALLVKRWNDENKERVRLNGLNYSRRIDQRIRRTFSNRIRTLIRGGKQRKSTFAIVGYTFDELKAHIQRQFTNGMSWDNYGEWHIDHIRPLSSFDITSYESEDFKVAWSLPNLRPLWAKDNISKGPRVTHLL